MFTGLIETIGTITASESKGRAVRLRIRPADQLFSAEPGSSIAVDGVCLTVDAVHGNEFSFTAVPETVDRTTLKIGARPGRTVNLERALPAHGRFEGHLVLGHVDAVGTIISVRNEDAGRVISIEAPECCSRFLAEKGSVAIDGISLTVARCDGPVITIALIPTTLESTTLLRKGIGDGVNIECDVIARYLARLLAATKPAQSSASPSAQSTTGGDSLLRAMEAAGF